MSEVDEALEWVVYAEEDLGRLSGYAVRTRYPGHQPTPEEARDALEIAMIVRKFARTFLGLKKH